MKLVFSKTFLLTVPRRYFFCLCIVFVMLSRMYIAALWSPAGKGLTSWLSFVMFYCVFVTFPCGILGQVWYLIVSIPDRCHLSYFKKLSTLPTFKNYIISKFNIAYVPPYFTIGNRYTSVLHARLRNEGSSLNTDIFLEIIFVLILYVISATL